MRQATLRWTIYILALCLLGPVAAMLTGSLRAADGSHAASPLFCTSPGMGLAMGLGAVAIALIFGIIAAKLQGVAPGFSAAGIILAWAAWGSGTIDEMIRTAHAGGGAGGPLVSQSIEGAIFGALTVGVALAIWLLGGKGDGRNLREKLFRGAATALPVAVIAAAAAAWFIGVTPLKGQAVFAAIGAGVIGAAAAKLVDANVTLPMLVVPIVALAVLGPLTGYAAGNGVAEASYAGKLFPLANITALDWIAGAMLGIPLGVAWAASMLEKKAGP